MLIDFSGQTALVTGGTRGIGKAVVDRLLDSGARVITTGVDTAQVASLAKAGRERLSYRVLDLADQTMADAFARDIAREPIDILINNAAISAHAPVGEIDLDVFDRLYRVNVRGPALLCRAIAPCMAERGYGRVVNISSILSVVGIAGRAPYATTKFALYGLTRMLALDYAKQGVLANCVAPGIISTEMTERALGPDGIERICQQVPLGRLGLPEEIARVVAFLASRENSFITGQNIIADGGYTSQ